MSLSVVIPALNEAEGLTRLLAQLAEQTMPPDQIVVADAGSTDGTRAVVEAAGASVVDGGLPARGRNAGASVATSDMLLFLDADVDLEPTFIAEALAEFSERELTIAGAHIEPIEVDANAGNLVACDIANLYLDVMQYAQPHAPGFCLLLARATHEAIGGFDEEVLLAEDHDYAQRAARLGKFRILRCMPVRTSMRRIEKEGILQLAFKYVYCELHVVAGQKIYDVPFDYEFAAFSKEEHKDGVSAVQELRERLGEFAGTLQGLSASGRDALRELGQREVTPELFEDSLAKLGGDDIARLRRYTKARVRLARRGGRHTIERVRSAGEAIWLEVVRAFR